MGFAKHIHNKSKNRSLFDESSEKKIIDMLIYPKRSRKKREYIFLAEEIKFHVKNINGLHRIYQVSYLQLFFD